MNNTYFVSFNKFENQTNLLFKLSFQQNLQVNATLINYLWTIGKPIKCNCIFFIHGNKNKCGFFQRF